MFKIGDYVAYKKDICEVFDIKENYFKGKDYYILSPIEDKSLKINVPVDNSDIRNLIASDQMDSLIGLFTSIDVIDVDDKFIENEYNALLKSGTHEDLIRIIKTAYLRNKEREDNNRRLSYKDTDFCKLAEKYLFNEFSVILGLSFEETRNYVLNKINELKVS